MIIKNKLIFNNKIIKLIHKNKLIYKLIMQKYKRDKIY